MIIAIDGYTATGKSTLASLLASEIGFIHINSGLLYRSISYYLLSNDLNHQNLKFKSESIESLVKKFQLDLYHLKSNLSNLRLPAVSMLGMEIAKLSFVRAKVDSILKNTAANSDAIIDGRDIGTSVFPNADLKFFFVADLKIRAKRIAKERGIQDFESIKKEIEIRDYKDKTRDISPLKRASDSIEIDTGNITIEEGLKILLTHYNEHKNKTGSTFTTS